MAESNTDTQQVEGLSRAMGRKRPWWYGPKKFIKGKPLGAAGAFIFLTIIFMALTADFISPYDPYKVHPVDRLTAPNGTYWFGTDYLGRDLLSRVIHGARVSLFVGVFTVLAGVGIGATLGLASGYILGKFDLIMQRVVDGFQAFPGIILALVIVTTLGPGLFNSLIAITVILITYTIRITRGHTLTIKENVYVEAARAIGASHVRIMVNYILPNIAAPIVVLGSIWLAAAVLIEASLSFLGLGAQPPTPSWGRMLSIEGRVYMESAPWLAIFPGVAISLVVLGINFLGDAIRDVWDPRLRGAQ
jgi:peptide/nickel transport system permease protein